MAITDLSIAALVRQYPADKLSKLQKALIDMQLSGTMASAFESNSLQFDSPEQLQTMIDRLEVALQKIESGGQEQTVRNIVYASNYDRNYWR